MSPLTTHASVKQGENACRSETKSRIWKEVLFQEKKMYDYSIVLLGFNPVKNATQASCFVILKWVECILSHKIGKKVQRTCLLKNN